MQNYKDQKYPHQCEVCQAIVELHFSHTFHNYAIYHAKCQRCDHYCQLQIEIKQYRAGDVIH